MTIHVFFMFPESVGKSLEEVDDIFNSGLPAWKTGKLRNQSKLNELTEAIKRGEDVDAQFSKDPTTPLDSDSTPSEKEKQLA